MLRVGDYALRVRRARYLWPNAPLCDLWRHRELIRQLVVRDIQQRYRGSYLGIIWSFLTPFLLLMAYTFVFSIVFQARWGTDAPAASTVQFALILFAGLIPFNMLAECVSRAPTAVVSVPNYVKKVVFPLEVLTLVQAGSALVQSLISVVVLLAATTVFEGRLAPTSVLLPLAYLPLVFLALGVGWFLAAIGVYVRDIGQSVTVIIQALMFLSPIFYPLSSVPAWLQPYLKLNPLTPIVEMFRGVLLWNEVLPWESWLLWTLGTALIAYGGYVWFMLNKYGFADVL